MVVVCCIFSAVSSYRMEHDIRDPRQTEPLFQLICVLSVPVLPESAYVTPASRHRGRLQEGVALRVLAPRGLLLRNIQYLRALGWLWFPLQKPHWHLTPWRVG